MALPLRFETPPTSRCASWTCTLIAAANRQNFEEYFEELFHQIYVDMAKQKLTPMDPSIGKRINDLDKRFGITMFPEQRPVIMAKYGLK